HSRTAGSAETTITLTTGDSTGAAYRTQEQLRSPVLKRLQEVTMKSVPQQDLTEFIGTLALIFVCAGSVAVLGFNGPSAPALVGIALAHGLVLGIMISNFGHISGGHFNPAVTVGTWVVGKIETGRAGVYLLAQLAGGAA